MTCATEQLQIRAIPEARQVAQVFLNVVDFGPERDLPTDRALIRLVDEQLPTQGLPLRRAIPGPLPVVGAGVFVRDGMGGTATAGGDHAAAGDDTKRPRPIWHQVAFGLGGRVIMGVRYPHSQTKYQTPSTCRRISVVCGHSRSLESSQVSTAPTTDSGVLRAPQAGSGRGNTSGTRSRGDSPPPAADTARASDRSGRCLLRRRDAGTGDTPETGWAICQA